MFRLEGHIKRFVGLSTDQKPSVGTQSDGATLTTADLPPGSSFLETDTGRIYRFSGVDWSHYEPLDEQTATLDAILRQSVATHRLLAAAFDLQPDAFY